MLSRLRLAQWFVSLVVTWSVCAATAPAASSATDAPSPIAVLYSASYDRWYENVALVGSMAGSPDLAQGLEAMLKIATAHRGLAGVDKTRPWAAVVVPRGPFATAYVCLPVDRLEDLLDVVRPLAGDITEQNGSHAVRLANGATVYVAQFGRWAVVAWDTDTIAHAVADPTPVLGDLPKRYDLALRVWPSRVPDTLRTILLARLDSAAADVRRADETESHYQIRRRLSQLRLQAARTGLDELDRVTLGLTVDRDTRRTTAELTLVAQPDTPAARRWERLKGRRSPLAGFGLPDAAITASVSCTPSPAAVEQLRVLLDAAQAEVLGQLDRPGPARGLQTVRSMIEHLGNTIRTRLTADRSLDAAVAVVVRPKLDATWVSVLRLPADDNALAKMAMHSHSLGKSDETAWSSLIQRTDDDGRFLMNAATVQFAGELGKRTKPLDWFLYPTQWGPRLNVTIGAGESNVYLAFGDEGDTLLARAVGAARAAPAAPVACDVALAPLAELAATSAEGPRQGQAALIAKVLKQSAGKDHLRLTVEPVDGGLQVRLQLDEGVVRVAGLMAGLLATDQPAPASPAAN